MIIKTDELQDRKVLEEKSVELQSQSDQARKSGQGTVADRLQCLSSMYRKMSEKGVRENEK